MNKKYLLAAAAVSMGAFYMPTAQAETVTTQTIVKQKTLPDTRTVNFAEFDLNKDGILTREEVGEKLFFIFDTDGNESIDNIEFDHKNVMTIIPMEKQTFVKVDWNDDGIADETAYSYQDFIQTSNLMAFDKDMDGLSASEFIGEGYQQLDDDNDKLINLEEWKEAYVESLSPKSAEQERYQH